MSSAGVPMANSYKSCSFCRFMRSFAFSAIGAELGGYGALAMGLEQSYAVIAAFFGALIVVLWVGRRYDSRK